MPPDSPASATGRSPAGSAPASLAEARRAVAARLAAAGGADADLDAGILLQAATGLDRLALLQNARQPPPPGAIERYHVLVDRRLAGEPVWRILGEREFWGLRFAVTPDVLDPRPDTETVVSAALDALGGRHDEPLRLLDLGTGSGAILCALCHDLPRAIGIGLDRSEAACRVAARNAARLALTTRILVVNGDWASALPDRSFDLVVSNPPYIETAAIPTLAREVRDFDPHAALDGGADGFDAYRAIVPQLPRLLKPGGTAVLEVGWTQASAVERLLSKSGLDVGATRRDLAGHLRAVVARRSAV